MTVQQWTFLFVACTFGLYLFVAWRARVRDTGGFYVAGRGVPAIANGIATAAQTYGRQRAGRQGDAEAQGRRQAGGVVPHPQ